MIYKTILNWYVYLLFKKNQNDNEIHKQVYINRKANIMCITHCMVEQQHANTESSLK